MVRCLPIACANWTHRFIIYPCNWWFSLCILIAFRYFVVAFDIDPPNNMPHRNSPEMRKKAEKKIVLESNYNWLYLERKDLGNMTGINMPQRNVDSADRPILIVIIILTVNCLLPQFFFFFFAPNRKSFLVSWCHEARKKMAVSHNKIKKIKSKCHNIVFIIL